MKQFLFDFFRNLSRIEKYCNPFDANLPFEDIISTTDDCRNVITEDLNSTKFLQIVCPPISYPNRSISYEMEDIGTDITSCDCH